MMYTADTPAIPGKLAMVPKPKYRHYYRNIGQSSALSFGDRHSVNLQLCKDKCNGRALSQPCQRGGYQDPKDCSKCICRPGFDGNFCQQIAASKGAQCGGSFDLTLTGNKVIQSPNYKINPYPYPAECNWYFKVPQNHQVKLKFVGFLELRSARHCMHWVEVVAMKNLDNEGAMYCRGIHYSVPVQLDPVVSESNEMLVLFRTFYVSHAFRLYGFKAFVEAIPPIPGVKTTTMPATTTQTTQRTTQTTTTIRTTFLQPSLAWECGFENYEWCNIKHDRSGNTYWRMKTFIKSFCRNTGPSKPHSGQYYISFEACRKKNNDKARIVLPAVPKSQDYCLEFWYYMKGRHIKQLNVYKYLNSGQKSKVWTESGDKGAAWKEAKVRISMAKGDKVVFEGVRGNGRESNIALDDMKLKVCSS